MTSEQTSAGFSAADLQVWAGGDENLVMELITIFLRIGPPTITRLQEALATGNSVATAQEAHDLKGSLTLLGAMQASADCARIETDARRAGVCPSTEEAHSLCASLLDIVEQVRTYAAAQPCLE